MNASPTTDSQENAGYLYGLLGVLAFSLSLPATRIAVADLDPTFVGLGRALVAATLGAILLVVTRQRWPGWIYLRSLLIVAAGVVVGFPLLSAWAMQRVPSNHGAIMLGILPLATAIAGVLRAGERPSQRFWFTSLAGSLTIVAFALVSGGGALHAADFALLGAVASAALGYAEGGRLARTLGGWQVICWALIVSVPFILIPVIISVVAVPVVASPTAWLGFAYVSIVSMFLGFFAWYRGLALGGVARVGQIQLLQPFFTLAASAALLGEHVTLPTVLVAIVVGIIVMIGRKTVVKQVAIPISAT